MTAFVYKKACLPPEANSSLESHDFMLAFMLARPVSRALSCSGRALSLYPRRHLPYLPRGWERAKPSEGRGARLVVSGREVTTERSRPACLAE